MVKEFSISPTSYRKELSFQEERNRDLNIRLQGVTSELSELQQQFFKAEAAHQESILSLHETLMNERKLNLEAEEELRIKNQEVQKLLFQLSQNENVLKSKNKELEQFKKQMKQSTISVANSDLETRLHSLTQTLIEKQANLEGLTTERNALRLQLEKLENEYHKVMCKMQQTTMKIQTVNDTDDGKCNERLFNFEYKLLF